MLEKVFGRDDRHRRVGVDDAEPTAEVVDVGVGVDDRAHRTVTTMLAIEGEGGRRTLRRDQRIDDHHTGVALDQRHVRQVVPADLVDAVGHLEQTMHGRQLRLTPETGGVHGVGTVTGGRLGETSGVVDDPAVPHRE